MTIEIVIDVSGEAAGSPGVAREFVYGKIDPTPPTVTCSLDDDTGITSYFWEFISQPVGASAVFSSSAAAAPTFTPTVSVSGTYLIKCTVNGGADFNTNALAFTTEIRAIRKPAPGETTQFSDGRGWEIAMAGMIDAFDGLTLVAGLSDLSDVGDTTKGNGRLMISDVDSFKSKIVSGAITIDETGATAINATPETVADDADLILIYDDTASLYKQMTRANFLSGVGAPTIYDDTTTFTDVAATGGTSTVQLDVGAIDDGIVEAVKLSITAGTSADTTIQLYDGDPTTTGNLIYEAPNLDLATQALDDRNCWYAEFVTQGDLWAKITNDGASISSYSLRLRIKGDA